MPPTAAIKEFVNTRMSEFHNKIGNDVCKTIKELDRGIKTMNAATSETRPNEQRSEFLPADISLIKKIEEKNIGINFKALLNGDWEKSAMANGQRHYRSKAAATLAFSSILLYFTQDREQFERILFASALHRDELHKKYKGQLDWAKNIANINTENEYKEVLFDLALWQYHDKTDLKPYDNTDDIANLTLADKQIIAKILKSKEAGKHQKLMASTWTNANSKNKDLKNLHIETLNMVGMFARHTKDDGQLNRLFKATPLYRPEIWDKPYKGQYNWLPEIENKGTYYGDVVKNFVLNRQKEWSDKRQKEWDALLQVARGLNENERQKRNAEWKRRAAAFNSKKMIRKAAISFRQINGLIIQSFFRMVASFDQSFEHSRSALKEQERKRKKEESQEHNN
jgi:hypothetical protein